MHEMHCSIDSVNNMREEKNKIVGKNDELHVCECVTRNGQEYRQHQVPFHGNNDSISRTEISYSVQSPD